MTLGVSGNVSVLEKTDMRCREGGGFAGKYS